MSKGVKNFEAVSKRKVKELTAVYNDYLYIARIYEDLIKNFSTNELANQQIAYMASKNIAFSWDFAPLSDREKQDFTDFMNNDFSGDNKRAYVILHHIDNKNDNIPTKNYAIPPYAVISAHMELPSSIEKYKLFYPCDGFLGNTEFFIDGKYKISCSAKNVKDISLSNFVRDTDKLQIFDAGLNIVDDFIKDNGMDKYFDILMNVYADQYVSTNENNILELMGTFAEKVVDICRKKYNRPEEQNKKLLQLAESDGLIKSAENFNDYICLRHFLRHQWDTLDELGNFTSRKSEENKYIRNLYVQAYLKICGKPRAERMKNYIDVLHQMQYVIAKLNSNWLIREATESNNKFFQRVKTTYNKRSKSYLIAELNYPLDDEKYTKLKNLMHKILPNINVADDFTNHGERLAKIDDYSLRSWFIQNFAMTECAVMWNCVRRGENLDKISAWKDIEQRGIISSDESDSWKIYAEIRNLLSHNYFNEFLRTQVIGWARDFEKDFISLRDKLYADGPDVFKVQKDVYEYKHNDGLDVELDYKHHTVAFKNIFQEENKKIRYVKQETYPCGIEIGVLGGDIARLKLPNGVNINMVDGYIDFGSNTCWKINDNHLNGFFSANSKILTNKNLRVVECRDKNTWLPFEGGDDFMVDYKHAIRIDFDGFLNRIKINASTGNVVQVRFIPLKNKQTLMLFDDGTMVTHRGKKMIVLHDGCILNFDNRRNFAMTYAEPKTILQQNVKSAYIH